MYSFLRLLNREAYRFACAGPKATMQAQASAAMIPYYLFPLIGRMLIAAILTPWGVVVASAVDGLVKVGSRTLLPTLSRSAFSWRLGEREATAIVDSVDWKVLQAQRLVAADTVDRFWILVVLGAHTLYLKFVRTGCSSMTKLAISLGAQLGCDTVAVLVSYMIVMVKYEWPVHLESYAAVRSSSLMGFWGLSLASVTLSFPFLLTGMLATLDFDEEHGTLVDSEWGCGTLVSVTEICLDTSYLALNNTL